MLAAVESATVAVTQWEQTGDRDHLVRALVTLSRHQWLAERPGPALDSARRAWDLAVEGSLARQSLARMNLGGLLVLLDREEEARPELVAALDLAERAGTRDMVALSHNYLGSARLQRGDARGEEDLLRCVELAAADANHDFVLRAYYNLVEGLWRLGHYDRADGYIDRALRYCVDRDFSAHAYMFTPRRLRPVAPRGGRAQAEAGPPPPPPTP